MDLVARVSSVHPPEEHRSAAAASASPTPANTTAAQQLTNSNASAVDSALALAKQQLRLNARDFTAICPILLYQLTANTSREKAGCIDEHLIASDFAGHRHGADVAGDDGALAPENRWLGRWRNLRD